MCVLQVILAYKSIVLCMCSGNVLNGYDRYTSKAATLTVRGGGGGVNKNHTATFSEKTKLT